MGYARLIWAAAAIARFYLGRGWGRGNSLRVRGRASGRMDSRSDIHAGLIGVLVEGYRATNAVGVEFGEAAIAAVVVNGGIGRRRKVGGVG